MESLYKFASGVLFGLIAFGIPITVYIVKTGGLY